MSQSLYLVRSTKAPSDDEGLDRSGFCTFGEWFRDYATTDERAAVARIAPALEERLGVAIEPTAGEEESA